MSGRKGVDPNISGLSFAHITAETTLFPNDQPNHVLQPAGNTAPRNHPIPVGTTLDSGMLNYRGNDTVLSGGSGPDSTGRWTLDYASDFGSYNPGGVPGSQNGQIFPASAAVLSVQPRSLQ